LAGFTALLARETLVRAAFRARPPEVRLFPDFRAFFVILWAPRF